MSSRQETISMSILGGSISAVFSGILADMGASYTAFAFGFIAFGAFAVMLVSYLNTPKE